MKREYSADGQNERMGFYPFILQIRAIIFHASQAYRVNLAKVYTRRAIERAAG